MKIKTKKIEYTNEKIKTSDTEIVHISVSGKWKLGSDGNDDARQLTDYVISLLDKRKSNWFIIDYSKLEYTFGDSIQRYAVEVLRQKADFRYAIVAKDNTRKNIESLLEFTNMTIGLIGIFDDIEKAIQKLSD